MSLQYRATFTDPDDKTQDRPQQIFSSTRNEVEAWAQKRLDAGGPNSFVQFYETREERIAFKRKPKPKETESTV